MIVSQMFHFKGNKNFFYTFLLGLEIFSKFRLLQKFLFSVVRIHQIFFNYPYILNDRLLFEVALQIY